MHKISTSWKNSCDKKPKPPYFPQIIMFGGVSKRLVEFRRYWSPRLIGAILLYRPCRFDIWHSSRWKQPSQHFIINCFKAALASIVNTKYLTLEAFQSYVIGGYKAREFVSLKDMIIDKVKAVLISRRWMYFKIIARKHDWLWPSIIRAVMVHY